MKTIVLYSDEKYKEHVLITIKSFSRVKDTFKFLYFQIDFFEELNIDGVDVECIFLEKVKEIPHMQLMKPIVLLKALDYCNDYIYVDCDTIISKHFNYDLMVGNVTDKPFGPVLHETFWQFPVFFWHDSLGIRKELDEGGMMNLLGVTERTQKWVTTLILAVTSNCFEFLEQWNSLCLNSELWEHSDALNNIGANHLEPYRFYFHMGDETPFNVLLWKHLTQKYYITDIVLEPRELNTFQHVEYKKVHNTRLEIDNPLTDVLDSERVFLYHQLKDVSFKNMVLDNFKVHDGVWHTESTTIKFGIYTSFYNCSRFVETIFSQIESLNYENFEWHITDDFSDDDTENLLMSRISKSPIREKIRYHSQTIKKEMYWSPNDFFDDSFDWIVLIDADDEVNPNFLIVYNHILSLEEHVDVSVVSSDFHKISDNNSLHSISYVLNNDDMSLKINRYHPECDYLNNISYYAFGHLRVFSNRNGIKFELKNRLAGAEDSYHMFWCNSYGRYLHIPRSLYKWNIRLDSESHNPTVINGFNDNFDIAFDKLKGSDGGVSKYYNDVYIETCAMGSYTFNQLNGKSVSIWTKTLSESEKKKLMDLYIDCNISFNDLKSDIHIICLNYITDEFFETMLQKLGNKKIMCYYQNQKIHLDNGGKDDELSFQNEKYVVMLKRSGKSFYWWSYIRHLVFFVNN
jgi:hypothetical protein